MLLRFDFFTFDSFIFCNFRKTAVHVFVTIVISFNINLHESFELDRLSIASEDDAVVGKVHLDGVEYGRSHAARNETVPYQFVEPVLITGKVLFHSPAYGWRKSAGQLRVRPGLIRTVWLIFYGRHIHRRIPSV